MEENQKFEKPAWVQCLEAEFSPLCQQLVGGLATRVFDSFITLVGFSQGLATAVLQDLERVLNDEISKTCNSDD